LQVSAPASTASADHSTNSDSKKPISNPKAKIVQRRHFAVCLGRGDVGYIDQVGRTYTAKAFDGSVLGVFADLKTAADAVSAAYKAGARSPTYLGTLGRCRSLTTAQNSDH
jgi:hypothetical protein